MITIVDYGLGNVQAIANIYKRLNIPVTMARHASDLHGARKVVLPGVGAFDWAITRLNESGMREPLDALVRARQCDVLGICVGMQILAERSEEGQLPGLGWIRGQVKLFDKKRFVGRIRLPHMGWNDALPRVSDSLFCSMSDPRFYFLHSYHFEPASESDVLATSDYGGSFVCSVRNRNVFGAQFHPEKSHQWGIQLLKNFAEI